MFALIPPLQMASAAAARSMTRLRLLSVACGAAVRKARHSEKPARSGGNAFHRYLLRQLLCLAAARDLPASVSASKVRAIEMGSCTCKI